MPTMTEKDWLRLGTIRPRDLVETRLELHHAVQLPAALGIARARPEPDFGHHALVWDREHHALLGATVEGPRPYRAGLRPATLALLLVRPDGALIEALSLGSRTRDEGLAWLAETTRRYTGEDGPELRWPEHELPEHGIASGARFEPGLGARGWARNELARWFQDVEPVLAERRADRAASPVRIWSHHFDMDTVHDLGAGRTLGLGFSPGDEGIAEPYLYLLPPPYPDERALPPLEPPFEYATEGRVGIVLRGSAVASLTAEEQAKLVERFYRVGEETLVPLLG
jgi:hypothetical protein